MKTAISLLIILSFSQAQTQTWTPRETFQGDSRTVSTSFTIADKGYVGLGLESVSPHDPLEDMWEYDPVLDRWLEITSFIGDPRWGAFSFVIDGKAYVGGGSVGGPGSGAFSGTFFQYDPVSNSWDPKENIPASRAFSTGFTIDGKGYVVFGYASGTRDETVIMYDPTLPGNPWTELTDIPNVVASAFAVEQPAVPMIIGNEAYLVGGIHISEVWKFNPTSDTWVPKNDVIISTSASFTTAGKGYIIGKRNECLVQGNNSCVDNKDVIMKYDEVADNWIEVAELPSNMNADIFENFAVTPCDLRVMVGNNFSGGFYEFDVESSSITSGPSLVCNSIQGTSYSLSSIPAGTSVTWSKSSNLNFVSGQGTSTVHVKPVAPFINGDGWVKATLTGGDCGNIELDQYDFWVGKPNNFSFTYYPNPFGCYSDEIRVDADGAESFDWNIGGGTVPSMGSSSFTGGNIAFVQPNSGASSISIQVRANNSCGSTGWISVTVPVSCWQGGGGQQLRVSPNPSAGDVDFTFNTPEEMETYFAEVSSTLKVLITDLSGEETYRGTLTKKGLHVNLRHAKTGIYIVRVYGKDFEHTSRLRIE